MTSECVIPGVCMISGRVLAIVYMILECVRAVGCTISVCVLTIVYMISVFITICLYDLSVYWPLSLWCWLLACLRACLTSQQHASVSQGRICEDKFT